MRHNTQNFVRSGFTFAKKGNIVLPFSSKFAQKKNMNIQSGDKVRFLDDVGGGIVRYFLGKDTVMVETDEGFEIPVNIKKLVKIENTAKRDPDHTVVPGTIPRKTSGEKALQKPEEESSKTVYFGVIPDQPFSVSLSDFHVYLINDTQWHFLFVLSEEKDGLLHSVVSKSIPPDTKIRLVKLSQSLITRMIYRISLLPFKKEPFHYHPPVDAIIDLRKYPFYKQKIYETNVFFDIPAVLIPIYAEKEQNSKETDPADQKALKEDVPPVRKESKVSRFPDIEEIDLHIEELVENPGSLTPSEILDIQLSRFTVALEGAIRAKQKRIVFIHGVGNGMLKYRIRKILDEKYSHLRYQDASYQEYGFGATMVLLR